jgi:ferrous iron transport protein A
MQTRPLSEMPTAVPCVVQSVRESDSNPQLKRHLEDIGFVPGERVMVMMRGFPGGDPIAVRVGESTFALRIGEAERIAVEIAST